MGNDMIGEPILNFFEAFNNPALLSFIVYFVAMILIRFTSISLKSFTGAYIFLTAIHVAFMYTIYDMGIVLAAAGTALAGAVAMLIAVGLIGKTRSSANFQVLMVGIGFFPWFLGWQVSLIYLGVALVFSAVLIWLRLWVAGRKYLTPIAKIIRNDKSVPEKLRGDIYSYFRLVILSSPVSLAATAAALSFIFL